MANVTLGIRRPSAIAKTLGVTRQAVHATIAQMVDKGMVELQDDAEDRPHKIVAPSAAGQAMAVDALEAVKLRLDRMVERVGTCAVLKASRGEDIAIALRPKQPSH